MTGVIDVVFISISFIFLFTVGVIVGIVFVLQYIYYVLSMLRGLYFWFEKITKVRHLEILVKIHF